MHRLFCNSKDISGDRIVVSDKEQVHHFKNVARCALDSDVGIFDEKGNEYICRAEKVSPEKAVFKIKESRGFVPQEKMHITLACAMPKKTKIEDIIDKATQLGVDRIIPLVTERVIVKLDKHKEALRQERWKKIALAASLQSQRNTIPAVEPVREFKEVLSGIDDFDLKLIPTLEGERKPLREVLDKAHPKKVLLFIGPEGDFSPEEVKSAVGAGCVPVTLGELVFRVETAAVAVVSFLRLYENR
jgi:16S rRNA (uracil1498-N3)-methyltransferase